MMKTILSLSVACMLAVLLNTGCRTAADATAGATDIAAHSVEKTGSAVGHGIRKVEKHL